MSQTDFEIFEKTYGNKKINSIQSKGAEGYYNHYEIDQTVLSFYSIGSERYFVFIGSGDVKGIEKILKGKFNLQKIPESQQKGKSFLICQLDANIITSSIKSERIENVTRAFREVARISDMGLDLYKSIGASSPA